MQRMYTGQIVTSNDQTACGANNNARYRFWNKQMLKGFEFVLNHRNLNTHPK